MFSEITYSTWSREPKREFDYNSAERKMLLRACETDKLALLDLAIFNTTAEDLEVFYKWALRDCVEKNATAVLKRVFEHGVIAENLIGSHVHGKGNTNIATLETLLEHGWDINKRGAINSDTKPFMWWVVRSHDMVQWCLDHGASVHPQGQVPLRDDIVTKDQRACRTILEEVVAHGSIATFELLRSEGAPLGWQTLHRAVETTTEIDPQRYKAGYEERMDMIRHLLDVVKLDVNAYDQPASAIGSQSTPICYIPLSTTQESGTKELAWLLLDHGADPERALMLAKWNECSQFIADVETWKGRQQGGGNQCCVQ